jgi:3-phenylpropionate/trans-cinnamate dioxygenase ferredoxin reductase subunit
MGRAVGPTTASHIHAAHLSTGLDIRVGSIVSSVEVEGGHASGVRLQDDTVIPAQLVLLAVGATPRVELARSLGLECENGVLVDEFSVASDGCTLAIGDCAAVPDPTPFSSGQILRLESVDHAIEQARAAASSIAGTPRPYVSLPWFWSDQGNLKLQIVGLRDIQDTTLVRRHDDPLRLTVLYYRGDDLVAAEAVNAPGDFMTVRKALMSGVSIDRSAAADEDIPLKSLVSVPDRGAT